MIVPTISLGDEGMVQYAWTILSGATWNVSFFLGYHEAFDVVTSLSQQFMSIAGFLAQVRRGMSVWLSLPLLFVTPVIESDQMTSSNCGCTILYPSSMQRTRCVRFHMYNNQMQRSLNIEIGACIM